MSVLRSLWQRVLEEPVFTQALVVAAIGLGSAFGLGWSGVQVAAVTTLSAAILSWLTRQAVTAMVNPNLPVGTSVNNGTSVVASRIPVDPPVAIAPPGDPAPIAIEERP